MLRKRKTLTPGTGSESVDNVVVTCDGCGDESHSEGMEFKDFISDLQEQDWRMYKDSGAWYHWCPECKLAANRSHKKTARNYNMPAPSITPKLFWKDGTEVAVMGLTQQRKAKRPPKASGLVGGYPVGYMMMTEDEADLALVKDRVRHTNYLDDLAEKAEDKAVSDWAVGIAQKLIARYDGA